MAKKKLLIPFLPKMQIKTFLKIHSLDLDVTKNHQMHNGASPPVRPNCFTYNFESNNKENFESNVFSAYLILVLHALAN